MRVCVCVCMRVCVSAAAAEVREELSEDVPEDVRKTLSFTYSHLVPEPGPFSPEHQGYWRYFLHIPRSSTLPFVENLAREPGCWHEAQAAAIESDWSHSRATSGHAECDPSRQLKLRMGREETAFKVGINQRVKLLSKASGGDDSGPWIAPGEAASPVWKA